MCQSIAQQGWKGQTKSHGSVRTSFKFTNCKKEQFENLVQLLLWTPSLLSEPIMVLVDPFLRQACANLQYGIVVKTEPANLLQSIFIENRTCKLVREYFRQGLSIYYVIRDRGVGVFPIYYNITQGGSSKFITIIQIWQEYGRAQGKVHKKVKKTNKCQFCLYTYIHSRKTNTFTFFPQAYMENFQLVSHQKIGELLCEAATSINSCLMEGFKEKSERAVCRILQTGSFL